MGCWVWSGKKEESVYVCVCGGVSSQRQRVGGKTKYSGHKKSYLKPPRVPRNLGTNQQKTLL